MKVTEKTTRKIVIEVTSEEIEKTGFENLWDDVRAIYPAKTYELHSITEIVKGRPLSIELRHIKQIS